MDARVRDRIVGAALIVFAVAWCTVVWITVPKGYGGAVVGPRDVPFWLGVALAMFALAMIGDTFLASDGASGLEESVDAAALANRKSELWALGVVTLSLIAYALLMAWFGFVIATIAVVGGILWFALGVRSMPLLLGMSLSMSFGVYFVMGTLMGVYLPRGTIFSPF